MSRTPEQTVGPYFALGLDALCVAPAPGQPSVRGVVRDGQGQAVRDAMLEVSAAVAAGVAGWQRVATNAEGGFAFAVSPRPTSGAFTVQVFARGLLRPLLTRCYLGSPPDPGDPFWAATPPARRATLLAAAHASRPGDFAWDIHLQSPDPATPETVFFTVAHPE